MVLAGKYVKQEDEKLKVRNNLIAKLQEQGVITKLQEIAPFNVEELELKLSYDFAVPNMIDNDVINLGNITALRANEYIQIKKTVLKNENNEQTAEVIFIDIIKSGDIVQTYMVEDGELIKEEPFVYLGNFLDDTLDYNQTHSEDFDAISAKLTWPDFCLAGGYKHCGPGCGDNKTYGGGTPINAVDTCCRAHDRCWVNFGSKDACCDRDIVNCVKSNRAAGPVASDLIVATFKSNAAKC